MAVTRSELIRLKALLGSLGVLHDSAMHLFYDNQAAFHIAKNPVLHERTKYIELDCHFVRAKLETSDISLSYIPSKQQLADVFAKLSKRNNLQFYEAS